jgi:hypothetical protein
MDNNDAWAEAFASAQGKVDDVSTSRNSETIVRRDKLHPNSSIASQVGVYRNDVDPRVEPFLPPITADQEPLYELQGPLLGHNCNMMKPCQMYTLSIKGRRQDEQCAICGSPPGLHLMTAKKNPRRASPTFFRENPVAAARLYVAVRNLRCSLRAQPESQPSVTIVKTFQNEVDQLLLTAKNGVTNPSSMVGTTSSTKKRKKRRRCDQEGSILRSDDKLVEACTHVQEMLPRFPAHGGNDQKLEWAIRAIMACDAIYYRLYYADLTSTSPLVIPHPVQYFGGWDDSEVDPMTNPTREQQQLLQNDTGLFDFNTSPAVPKLPVSHALERLHLLRRQESRFLFSRLASVQDWTLLRDWQDSCRDFLCHLYAYATLSADTLQTLKDRLQGHVVAEMGAGTGYLSHLIGNVTACDCHPGSVDNEYHAATPPFTSVNVGGPRDIVGAAYSALILCYPPVDNDMAYEALEVFLSSCDKKKRPQQPSSEQRRKPSLLVHIGEFQGLTGTPRFESLLVEKLNCIDRFPCLSWGSDTAEISFWEPRSSSSARGDKGRRKMAQLVSCRRCENRPATIRFRYARTHCYCDIACAKLDETNLRGVLPSCFASSLTWTASESQQWEFLRAGPAG